MTPHPLNESSCDAESHVDALGCDACGDMVWPGPQQQHAVTIRLDGHADGDTLRVHASCAGTPLLRCLYSTWDAPGGPEEGGWTFEVGALEAAVPAALVYDTPTLARVTGAADALLDAAYAGLKQRRIWAFGLPALSFPEVKPHYE